MEQAIRHRGPDGAGVWSDAEAGIGLSHRRLAILDLSEAGAQPMVSASGRYIVTYNGEIYNFPALRAALIEEGWPDQWRGGSDTEVLLAAIEHWGLSSALPRLNGMFALGVWDRQIRQLTLARDRFGEKPLYYGYAGGALIFGSELAALEAAAPEGLGAYDPRAIDHLVRSFCIPAPLSIYQAIAKLPPASFLSFDADDVAARRLPEPRPYWSAADDARSAAARPFSGSPDEAARHLSDLLTRSIALRLVADVPVGAMLSGGIDSTTICALAQQAASAPLRTFTIGVDDPAYDEAPHAAAIAKALATDHSTIRVGADDVVSAVPDMARIYDEPFADASQVVTTILARALRREVTVALSGDAGDELFGGYVRYRNAPRIWSRLRTIPQPVRRIGAVLIRGIGQDRLSGWMASLTGSRGEAAGRVHKALGLIDSASDAELYARLLEVWPEWTRRGSPHDHPMMPAGDGSLSFARRMMLADTIGYLPSDVLAKVDRASMSTALETRVPFLDPDVFRFAWSLPDAMLFGNGHGKLPLRMIAERHVPAALLARPKQGFAPPIGAWLRGSLKDWAWDLIENEQVSSYGVIDAHLLRRAWDEHQAGRSDESARLWPVLMFGAWSRAHARPQMSEAA